MAIEASTIFKVINSLINQDDKDKIEHLYDAYTAAMEKMYDLRDEINELKLQLSDIKQENKRLNEIIERKEQLIRKGKAYYYREPEGEISGPICPNCYSKDNIVNFLTSGSNGAHCSICKCSYPGVDTKIEGPKRGIL